MNDLTNQRIDSGQSIVEKGARSRVVDAELAAECAVVEVARSLAYQAMLSFWMRSVKLHGKGRTTLDIVEPPVVPQSIRDELSEPAPNQAEVST